MKYSVVRGTKDILPEETGKWQYVEKVSREIFRIYGFSEMRTPLFEKTELFVRAIGTDTDIVTKEMYNFKDKKGRELTLRPEGTAGIIRAAVENNLISKDQNTKLYYMGPMYRYERPQKGRQREFYQVGAELIGEDKSLYDYEIIALVWGILGKLGLKNLKLYINSVGCSVCRLKYLECLRNYFKNNVGSMCTDCGNRLDTNIMRILDCKNDKDRMIIEKAPKIRDFLCDNCKMSYNQLKVLLASVEIKYEEDSYMVRGLDYYTKNVFEVKYSGLGAQNTLAAGGRYNNLVSEMGGPGASGTGFSIGMERLLMVCEKENVTANWEINGVDVFFALIGNKAIVKGRLLLSNSRSAGISCECDYSPEKSLKSQMKRADKLGCKYVVIIGDDELSGGKAILRNMKDSSQEEVEFDSLVKELKNKL